MAAPDRTPLGLPPHLAGRSRALRIAAALAVAAALASAVAGWLVRGATAPAPAGHAAPLAQTGHAGPARVTVPGDWKPVAAMPGLKGMDPRATAVFQPVAAISAYAVVTFAPVGDPSLVPASLRPLLPAALPKPKPETLGGARAWRYGEMPAAGDRTMELTVAPTDRGVFAVACIAAREAWVAALGCAEQLRSVSLDHGTWLQPGADVAVRARIPGAIARLDARRVTIRSKLHRARTAAAQRRLGRRLAAAYATAAGELAPIAPRTGAPARVVAALRAAADANRRMAVAAGHHWPGRYALARGAVKRSDAELSRALAALR
jgi:hypothetical protein